jgi:hypothetical protein
VDTNWSDGANWSLEAPPLASQTALFIYNSFVKSFASTVDAAFTHSIAVQNIDPSWGGTITVSGALSVTHNLTLGSGILGGSGTLTIAGQANQLAGGIIAVASGGTFTNAGTLNWTSGQIGVDTSQFINTGTLNVETPYKGNLVLTGAGTLTNDGTINETGYGSLALENGATLNNTSVGTFNLTNDCGISQVGGGTFTNAGTLEKTGGIGTSTIAPTSLDNPGVVAVKTGTMAVAATVTQVAGKTLRAGHWFVTSTPMVAAVLDITSAGNITSLGAGATVTLSGPRTAFGNLTFLSTIDHGARFSLLGGLSFAVAGALTNGGELTLSPSSIFTVAGSFTQTSTGSLTLELGGPSSDPTLGQVLSTTGTGALAGSLNVTSKVVPAVGSSFTVLENEGNSAIGGDFAGLPQGSTFKVKVGKETMTFQITYVGPGKYGDNNVVITRIS